MTTTSVTLPASLQPLPVSAEILDHLEHAVAVLEFAVTDDELRARNIKFEILDEVLCDCRAALFGFKQQTVLLYSPMGVGPGYLTLFVDLAGCASTGQAPLPLAQDVLAALRIPSDAVCWVNPLLETELALATSAVQALQGSHAASAPCGARCA